MNQQEIDRLWDDRVTRFPGSELGEIWKDDFTAAIQEATAQARREALEEAATVCESAKKRIISTDPDGTEFVADWCARNVRALAQKEGKHD